MISIIVPVYNCIHTLDRCVRGICAQTMEDWEILLIDDGSTDGSDQMCDHFAAEDARIHVFHKPNGGVSSARNLGLDHARGEYVMFCDSDDWAEPEWCETLYLAAKGNPGRQPICNYYRNTADCESINREGQCGNLGECIAKADFFFLNRYELLGIPWNKIYLRSVLEDNHIRFRPDLSLGEDFIFNLDYMKFLADGYIYIHEPLYHYSLGNGQSLSEKFYPDLQRIYHVIFAELKAAFMAIPDAFARWEADYYRSYFFAFDRFFRNTFSSQNPLTKREKWRANSVAFRSEEFQQCKNAIPKHYINILQYWGLQGNSFCIYWTSVIVSEKLSKVLHRNRTR